MSIWVWNRMRTCVYLGSKWSSQAWGRACGYYRTPTYLLPDLSGLYWPFTKPSCVHLWPRSWTFIKSQWSKSTLYTISSYAIIQLEHSSYKFLILEAKGDKFISVWCLTMSDCPLGTLYSNAVDPSESTKAILLGRLILKRKERQRDIVLFLLLLNADNIFSDLNFSKQGEQWCCWGWSEKEERATSGDKNCTMFRKVAVSAVACDIFYLWYVMEKAKLVLDREKRALATPLELGSHESVTPVNTATKSAEGESVRYVRADKHSFLSSF